MRESCQTRVPCGVKRSNQDPPVKFHTNHAESALSFGWLVASSAIYLRCRDTWHSAPWPANGQGLSAELDIEHLSQYFPDFTHSKWCEVDSVHPLSSTFREVCLSDKQVWGPFLTNPLGSFFDCFSCYQSQLLAIGLLRFKVPLRG